MTNTKKIHTISKDEKKVIDNDIYGLGINSYNRFGRFLNYEYYYHTPSQYYYAFKNALIDTDDTYNYKDEITRILEDFNEENRIHIMNKKEFRSYHKFPENIIIYRGILFFLCRRRKGNRKCCSKQ